MPKRKKYTTLWDVRGGWYFIHNHNLAASEMGMVDRARTSHATLFRGKNVVITSKWATKDPTVAVPEPGSHDPGVYSFPVYSLRIIESKSGFLHFESATEPHRSVWLFPRSDQPPWQTRPQLFPL